MKLEKSVPIFKIFLILFAIPFTFMLILRILGFDGLYGQDTYEYLKYTKLIKEYFILGKHPGSFYWPVLYPFIGSILSFILGNIISLQLISCLSLSICALYVLKSIHVLYNNYAHSIVYVVIFLILSPYFLKMGLVVMSDMMSAMFVIITFYYFFKIYINSNSKIFPVFFFATCALMTRYASLVITFPVILYSIYILVKRKDLKSLLISILLSILVCIPFIFFQFDNLLGGTSNYFLNSWSFLNYFKSSYITADGLQIYRFPNLIFVFSVFIHPGYIFIGFILVFINIKKFNLNSSFPQKITIISILLYLGFLAGIPFQNTRVLGLIFPLVLIFFYPTFYKLIHYEFIKKNFLLVGIACVILQLFLWNHTFKNIYKRNSFEKEMVSILANYQERNLYSFDVSNALKNRGLNFEFKNMYHEKYNDFKINDLVLFNPAAFAVQWDDKNPMLNWSIIDQKFELKILEKCPDGWNLYEIVSIKK